MSAAAAATVDSGATATVGTYGKDSVPLATMNQAAPPPPKPSTSVILIDDEDDDNFEAAFEEDDEVIFLRSQTGNKRKAADDDDDIQWLDTRKRSRREVFTSSTAAAAVDDIADDTADANTNVVPASGKEKSQESHSTSQQPLQPKSCSPKLKLLRCDICCCYFKQETDRSAHRLHVHGETSLSSGQQQQYQQQQQKSILPSKNLKSAVKASVLPSSLQGENQNENGDIDAHDKEKKDKEEKKEVNTEGESDASLQLSTNTSSTVGQSSPETASNASPNSLLLNIGDSCGVIYNHGKPESHKRPHFVYRAKVIDRKWSTEADGCQLLYLVHFDGWKSNWDEWVTEDRLFLPLKWLNSRSDNPGQLNIGQSADGRRKTGTF